MRTKDIGGAQPGTKSLGAFHSRERRHFRELNKTEDVPGAQPGTFKKAPETNRHLNPLAPKYVLPGETELSPHASNDPYNQMKMMSSMD